ncbi:hypothetical protein [Nocardia australiensis]|uniref:hypothetical protein n=1 Tax=Nocardia australiensis TaxID=2887191 RepID=UPI001D138C17|nr:hypothetical protein [Nocardia australiensis]
MAVALTGITAGTAAAAPGCNGSMNGQWAYNGVCGGEEGSYRLEIDCIGFNFGANPPIGQFTMREDLPVGRAGTVSCFGPNWSSAGVGVGARIFRL